MSIHTEQNNVSSGVIYLQGLSAPNRAVIRDSIFEDASAAVRMCELSFDLPGDAYTHHWSLYACPHGSFTAAPSAWRGWAHSPCPAVGSPTRSRWYVH